MSSTPPQPERDRPFPHVQLVVLATAAFITMTIEFLPSGLIPLIARDFDESLPRVGSLVWSFAVTVVATTLPSAWITRHARPKSVLVIALLGIGGAAVLAAIAPGFAWLIVARILGGVAHGLFWSVGSSYAANIVSGSQLGRATAFMSAGGAAASIAGVPIANLLGQLFGWRVAFWFVAGAAFVIIVAVTFALDSIPSPNLPSAGRAAIEREVGLPSRIPIIMLSAVLGMIVVATTSYGTYSVAWLIRIVEFDPERIPILLSASAIVGAFSLAVTARFADRHATLLMTIALSGITVSILGLVPLRGSVIGVVLLSLLWGLSWGTVPTLLQASIMRVAAPAQRSFAGALQTTTINIGIGGGALIGGVIIQLWGLERLPLVAGALLAAAAATVLVAERSVRRASELGGRT